MPAQYAKYCKPPPSSLNIIDNAPTKPIIKTPVTCTACFSSDGCPQQFASTPCVTNVFHIIALELHQ